MLFARYERQAAPVLADCSAVSTRVSANASGMNPAELFDRHRLLLVQNAQLDAIVFK